MLGKFLMFMYGSSIKILDIISNSMGPRVNIYTVGLFLYKSKYKIFPTANTWKFRYPEFHRKGITIQCIVERHATTRVSSG